MTCKDSGGASLKEYKSRPGVGIAVIISSDEHPGCVIVGKRKSKIGKGLFQLPGGHLEFGESWEECACRETLEETGLHVENVKFFNVVNSVEIEINYHYVTIFMKGKVGDIGPSEPENKEPDKCEGWQWIKWEEIPEPKKLFYALRDFKALNINPLEI